MKWFSQFITKPKRHEKEEALFPFREFLAVGNEIIDWSNAIAPPVYNVEWVTPNIYTPRTSVWVFCEHEDGLAMWSEPVRAQIEAECIRLLLNHHFPERLLAQVIFAYDSHENVTKNYEGSYFYRLRG